ncbi:MAG: flagellar hook-length control protein FliK [Candidatus Accumulibacter sp.]|jgi:hypothetical protein|nr:flagellar hook-length control protein FliK [Accumulibacter sp.]
MIPPDLASRLATQEVSLRPVAPVQEISDKLSDFTVGQRLMAEIQALLPNGTYRALVNQRNITLALPFSARSGDSLELEVTESDGRLALAVVAHRDGAGKESVSATLSRAGQLIGKLLSGADDGNEGKALPLNGNRPIAGTPPGSAQDLLPLLKQAIGRSGMFYESHQAEWVEGRFTKMELLQEPQGKLSTSAAPGAEMAANSASTTRTAAPGAEMAANSASTARTAASADPQQAGQATQTVLQKAAGEANPQAGQMVAPQTQGIVHQQLEALANQTFVWQGQIWPGQDMRWEIEEDGHGSQEEDDDAAQGWRTRLDLSFPELGGISAKLQLHGSQVSLALYVDNESSLGLMRSDAGTLRQRLEDAGLTLASLGMALPSEAP